MKKSSRKILVLVVNVLRYLLPLVLGWLEGDTHAMQQALVNLCTLLTV